MISDAEKEQLKKPPEDSKKRADLYYRITKKIKNKLKEDINEVNQALRLLPETNAARAVDDEMAASIFRLSEEIVRILGYVPIEGRPGTNFVTRPAEVMSKYADREVIKIVREAPKKEDIARYFLLEKHIKKLQRFAYPEKVSDNIKLPVFNNRESAEAFSEGVKLHKRWQEVEPW